MARSTMNPLVVVATLAIALNGSLRLLRRIGDARNIERLRRRYGCEQEEAERLYRLSRRVGFGYAHRKVFGARGHRGSAARR